jgi:hypothetical protein
MAPKAKARAARQSWQAAHKTLLTILFVGGKAVRAKGEAMKAIVPGSAVIDIECIGGTNTHCW